MTTAMMIDLETLSTTPRAAIMQVGWCVFDPRVEAGVHETGEVNVNVDSCMCLGGEVSDGTVRWWLDQSPEARASVARPGVDICHAVAAVVEFYQRHNCKQLWAHSPSFDVVILEHYMRLLGVETPWRFYDLRDTRTHFAAAEANGWVRPKTSTAHTARADAVAQALDVQRAWQNITGDVVKVIGPDPTDPSFRQDA